MKLVLRKIARNHFHEIFVNLVCSFLFTIEWVQRQRDGPHVQHGGQEQVGQQRDYGDVSRRGDLGFS